MPFFVDMLPLATRYMLMLRKAFDILPSASRYVPLALYARRARIKQKATLLRDSILFLAPHPPFAVANGPPSPRGRRLEMPIKNRMS